MAIMTGTVTTPDHPQRPSGWLWDQLNAATTRETVAEVGATAERLGYAPDGQLRRAVADRLALFDAPEG